MLPAWIRNGNVGPLHVPRSYTPARLVPILILLLLVGWLLGSTFPGSVSRKTGNVIDQLQALKRTTSPFLIPVSDILPPQMDSYMANQDGVPAPRGPKRRGMRVPNSVHYVFGLKPVKEGELPEELPYYAYLAMRSALVKLKPEKMYFHYKHLPRGLWWDEIKPFLTLVETDIPDEIYGNKLEHFAHKADIVRLKVMKYSGGIYLDIDMFVTKSFDELMSFPTTMGMEARTNPEVSSLDPEGLCNAVIISEPNSPFVDRWISSYQTFKKEDWAGHSVRMPWKLARQNPLDIQVLNATAFFWPMWSGDGVQHVHELNDYNFYETGQYAYHAWESLAMKYLNVLSPDSIRNTDTSFHRLVRPLIGPNDDEIYRKWTETHPGH